MHKWVEKEANRLLYIYAVELMQLSVCHSSLKLTINYFQKIIKTG